MALFHITIEKLVVKTTDTEDTCELKERIKELEKQQEDWLLKIDKAIGKIETVSEQVDSTK